MTSRLDLGPRPLLGYASSRIERMAERRCDPATLAAFAHPDSRAYLIGGELVALKTTTTVAGHEPLFAASEMPAGGAASEPMFLGLQDGAPRFAVALDAAAIDILKAQPAIELVDLRSIAVRGLVHADHLAALAEAKALMHWHARNRFCANCGAATKTVESGWRRDCPSCASMHFPRTDPVVIMLAIAGERCVLGRSHRFQPGMWSCLAGFVEPGETIEEAVRRETREEAGIDCGHVSYFASQPWPFPASLMIGCYVVARTKEIVVDRNELEDARWFDREEVALMLLGRHPGGLTVPQPVAIAHHILRAWAAREIDPD